MWKIKELINYKKWFDFRLCDFSPSNVHQNSFKLKIFFENNNNNNNNNSNNSNKSNQSNNSNDNYKQQKLSKLKENGIFNYNFVKKNGKSNFNRI